MSLTYEQTFFIVTLCCYLIAAALLWRSVIMKPFKLWTTFLHEFSHAIGAWVCCHKVTGIEVHADEGGLTHWQGRNVDCARHLVLPAGYLGSTLWGCLIMLSVCSDTFTRVMSILLIVALTICLFYASCGETKNPGDRCESMPDHEIDSAPENAFVVCYTLNSSGHLCPHAHQAR